MKSNNITYDVIIIGAGPAGLTAAKVLANNQKKVLVLEKNSVVGDKVCAGGLTVKDLKEFNIPKFLIEKEFKYINLYIDNRLTKLKLEKPWIWTCSRRELGKWHLAEAKKQGAEIQLNSRVIKIQKNSVLVNNREKLSFKYLIGADGSNSMVRRFLALRTKKTLMGMQYLVPKGKFNNLEIFFDLEKFGPTYAWIFPHKEFDSVGVCANPNFIKSNQLKKNFDGWCKKFDINTSNCKFQAAPINYDYQGVEFNNIFLIGDAAGLASGLTGEGIHPAMVSGIEVARKIVDPDYNFKQLKELIKVKRLEEKVLTSYKINKIITKIGFDLGSLLLKRKRVRRKLIKFLTNK